MTITTLTLYCDNNTKIKEYITYLRVFYAKLIARCNQLSFCFDITNIAPPLGNNYNDPRHHNHNGNAMIAEAIYKVIMR